MRAQAAVEFLTSYGLAFLAIIALTIAVYYLLSVMPTQPECNFGIELQCTSYQFFKKSNGDMRLKVTFVNGLGRVIGLYPNSTITVQNIGRSGLNNYTGNCAGPADMVKSGDVILCLFDISDREIVPGRGKSVKFDVLINYTLCETDKYYPVRCNGTNRTMHGAVTTPFEEGVNYPSPYCMDGVCEPPETNQTCPWDCPPPRPGSLTVTSTANGVRRLLRETGMDQINVTVYDQDGNPLLGTPVLIFIENLPSNPGVVEHITSYSIMPYIALTNASGIVAANFSWYACNCCFPTPCKSPTFRYAAIAGPVYDYDPNSAVLNNSLNISCCT